MRAPLLTPRQAQLAFIPLVVTTMSGVISFAMSALHHGFTAGLLRVWLQHWPVAFIVALPTAWVVLPGIRRMLERLSRPQPAADARLGRLG